MICFMDFKLYGQNSTVTNSSMFDILPKLLERLELWWKLILTTKHVSRDVNTFTHLIYDNNWNCKFKRESHSKFSGFILEVFFFQTLLVHVFQNVQTWLR